MKEKELLNELDVKIIIERLCQELIEHHDNFNNTVIVGLQPRGTLLKNRILENLSKKRKDIRSGNIDISFYRDDLRRREKPIIPNVMDMDLTVEGKEVVLVDDVLYTGRSVRSAIDALMTFGRPKSVELLVLIDRKFSRDLPIQANYIGKRIDVLEKQKVMVEWNEISGKDRIVMSNFI
tara:strand:+ start:38 stop:574 length:537 start_codon:yes stop_codon:yes gene_type:complete